VDFRLISGAAIFGLGWALSGYCPGPGITAMGAQNWTARHAVSGMILGWIIEKWPRSNYSLPDFFTKNLTWLFVSLVYIVIWVAPTFLLPTLSGAPHPFNVWDGVYGGSLIGISIVLLMLLKGETLGVSGVLGALVEGDSSVKSKLSRFSFFSALYLGGYLLQLDTPLQLDAIPYPWPLYSIGGVLIGFGTSRANGCTSGHGICGITNMSKRSVFAVITFFCTNMLTTTILHALTKGVWHWLN